MPTRSGIIGTVKLKMEDGTFVDLPDPISLEEITTFAEQYEFVKVVRCKDCKYRKVNENYGKRGYLKIKAMCELDNDDVFSLGRCADDEDWFCADGERKSDS